MKCSGSGVGALWVSVLALLLTHCVLCARILNLLKLLVSSIELGMVIPTSPELMGKKYNICDSIQHIAVNIIIFSGCSKIFTQLLNI